MSAAESTQRHSPRSIAAKKRALLPIGASVGLQEIATATLTIRWEESELGNDLRRERLALLHLVAAEVCRLATGFDHADPKIEMGNARGVVQIEMKEASDYHDARDILEIAMSIRGHLKPVRL